MLRTLLRVLALPVLLVPALAAQTTYQIGPLTVTVTPDPAPFGALVSTTATNTSPNTVVYPEFCITRYTEGIGGTVVWGDGCPSAPKTLQPGDSVYGQWYQVEFSSQQVPPGLYSVRVHDLSTGGEVYLPIPIQPCPVGSLATFGQGCGIASCVNHGTPSPTLYARTCPQVGTTFTLSMGDPDCFTPALLFIGSSNTSWAGVPLPFSLGGGCNILVSAEVSLPSVNGLYYSKEWPIPLPNDPSLQGARLFSQALTAEGGVLKMTNGLEVVFG